jgi:hypothetical protein
MSARVLRYGSIAVLFLSICTSVCAATSVSFTGIPSTVDQEQEFEADVMLVCTGCTSDSFIRGVLYPSGSSYFGYTQTNSGVWVNAPGGSCTEYFKIAPSDLKEGSWSGKLKFKPDSANAFYTSQGEYLFKIGRYTASCGTPTWSTETTIAITGPTNTPSPTPTSTPANTPTHTTVPTNTVAPTKSPNPTVSPTVKPSITSASTTTSEAMVSPTIDPSPTDAVLGISDPPPSTNKPYIIALLFISMGCALLAAVFVVKNRLYLKK